MVNMEENPDISNTSFTAQFKSLRRTVPFISSNLFARARMLWSPALLMYSRDLKSMRI